jgi:hypothetical protein
VHLPESWTERLPLLEDLEQDWEPVRRAALLAWIIFYALFLYQAARGSGILLLMADLARDKRPGGKITADEHK